MSQQSEHQVVVVGGGTAGLSVAARLLRRAPRTDVAIVEPSDRHYYQPLWTLVGGGVFPREASERAENGAAHGVCIGHLDKSLRDARPAGRPARLITCGTR